MSVPTPPLFSLALRVYWEDTDAGGIVFYANYLKFFERARTEWLRSLGHGQERLRVEDGLMFVVTDTSLRFLRPARLDDLLDVSVAVLEARPASVRIAQQAWRRSEAGAELLAEGTIRLACVDTGTYGPRRIPNFLTLVSQGNEGPLPNSLLPLGGTDAAPRRPRGLKERSDG